MKRDQLARLAALERSRGDEKLSFVIYVVSLVPDDDPLCGLWQENPTANGVFAREAHFYGRDRAHLNALIAEYEAKYSPTAMLPC